MADGPGLVNAIDTAVGGLHPKVAQILLHALDVSHHGSLAGTFADPVNRLDAIRDVADLLHATRSSGVSMPMGGDATGLSGEGALLAAIDALVEAQIEATELVAASLPARIDLHSTFTGVDHARAALLANPPPTVDERWADTMHLAELDLAGLARAESALVKGVLEAQRLLANVDTAQLPTSDGECAKGPVVLEVVGVGPVGSAAVHDCYLVVGGPDANVYDRDVTISIDLGGADRYENNAGSWDARAFRCDTIILKADTGASLAVDLGRADDVYETNVPRWGATQGAGIYGAGLLVDQGGDDTYTAHERSGDPCSFVVTQGSGWYGAGVLWDRGGGDQYTSPANSQGSGGLGLGVLVDEGGNDVYSNEPLLYDSELAQGGGCAGIGVLDDRGDGDDAYVTGVADVQAMGCLGGIGILQDGGGDDRYVVLAGPGELSGQEGVIQSGWGQGHGEVGGIGLLVDRGGDDAYEAAPLSGENRTGFRVQGVGVRGIGALIDETGNDTYLASQQSQAFGYVEGVGLLYDGGGNDTYEADDLCQASAGTRYEDNAAFALLYDASGVDAYGCDEAPEVGERADAHVWYSTRGFDPNLIGVPWPYRGSDQVAIGIDVGG